MRRSILINPLAVFILVVNVKFCWSQQNDTTIGPSRGTLIIVGGGAVGADIWARFIEAAGGANANIVVIPTALDDSSLQTYHSTEKDVLERSGVKNVIVLHTRDRNIANSDSFVAIIKKATGVWLGGGRQWRLADAYLNTATHKEFKALLNRGGVIAGSSAGATIQGSLLLRGDTKNNTTLIGDHLQGFDLIHDVTIDQHILRRNRQFDLVQVIRKYPRLLGIGIDESTAIVVHQNNFEVIGNSYVAIYDFNQFGGKTKNPSSESGNTGDFYFLGKGQRFDLKERRIVRSVAVGNGGRSQ